MSQDDYRSVELPAPLVERVEARLGHTEFETPGEYAAYALGEVLAHVETEATAEFDAADEAAVRERLESLGYVAE